MTKSDRMVNQLFSGRWILTVLAGLSLFLLVLTDCKALLAGNSAPVSVEAIFSVITMVFVSYFNRPTENDNTSLPPVPKP